MARDLHAETIDYTREDPVEMIRELTGGIGVDRAIDAVGVDAKRPHEGPAAPDRQQAEQFDKEVEQAAPRTHPHDGNWVPGDAPSQALRWALSSLAKAGGLAIIGVYPPTDETFPIGMAMNKNITMRMGNCNHRKYLPKLVDMVRSGRVDPMKVLTQREPLMSAIDAYQVFDERRAGWMKVKLEPAAAPVA